MSFFIIYKILTFESWHSAMKENSGKFLLKKKKEQKQQQSHLFEFKCGKSGNVQNTKWRKLGLWRLIHHFAACHSPFRVIFQEFKTESMSKGERRWSRRHNKLANDDCKLVINVKVLCLLWACSCGFEGWRSDEEKLRALKMKLMIKLWRFCEKSILKKLLMLWMLQCCESFDEGFWSFWALKPYQTFESFPWP